MTDPALGLYTQQVRALITRWVAVTRYVSDSPSVVLETALSQLREVRLEIVVLATPPVAIALRAAMLSGVDATIALVMAIRGQATAEALMVLTQATARASKQVTAEMVRLGRLLSGHAIEESSTDQAERGNDADA